MALFLTTRGISSQLEELFIGAESYLFIITPYLQFSKTLYERLSETTKRGIVTSIVCKDRENLTAQSEKLLLDLECNIYFKKDLHAKCYVNEQAAMIASMNLYNYSEANNREMGVLLTCTYDNTEYLKCLKEVKSIINNSEQFRILQQVVQPTVNLTNTTDTQEFSYEKFIQVWYDKLSQKYPTALFLKVENTISAKNFPFQGIDFSTKYGFVTLNYDNNSTLELLRDTKRDYLRDTIANYRVFWHTTNRICMYHAQNIEFAQLNDDIEYCASGLEQLISEIALLLNTKV